MKGARSQARSGNVTQCSGLWGSAALVLPRTVAVQVGSYIGLLIDGLHSGFGLGASWLRLDLTGRCHVCYIFGTFS
jgi:hypothetical protein